MSVGRDLLDYAFGVLLDHHETSVVYTPHGGGQTVTLKALDNGQPEEAAALALQMDGLSRIITVTRGSSSFTPNSTVVIGTTSYKVLAVRNRSSQSVDLFLGATVIAGEQ